VITLIRISDITNSDINQSINQSLIPFTDIAKGGFQRNASNASADQSGCYVGEISEF